MEFIDLLRAVGVGNIGFAGCVTLAVILIYRGKLQPESSVEARILDKESQIIDWKSAYEKEREARSEMSGQITQLLEYAKTSDKVLTALRSSLLRNGSDSEESAK